MLWFVKADAEPQTIAGAVTIAVVNETVGNIRLVYCLSYSDERALKEYIWLLGELQLLLNNPPITRGIANSRLDRKSEARRRFFAVALPWPQVVQRDSGTGNHRIGQSAISQ